MSRITFNSAPAGHAVPTYLLCNGKWWWGTVPRLDPPPSRPTGVYKLVRHWVYFIVDLWSFDGNPCDMNQPWDWKTLKKTVPCSGLAMGGIAHISTAEREACLSHIWWRSYCLNGEQGLFKHLPRFQNAGGIFSSPNKRSGLDMNGWIASSWERSMTKLISRLDFNPGPSRPSRSKAWLFFFSSHPWLLDNGHFQGQVDFGCFPPSPVCCPVSPLEGWGPFPMATTG